MFLSLPKQSNSEKAKLKEGRRRAVRASFLLQLALWLGSTLPSELLEELPVTQPVRN